MSKFITTECGINKFNELRNKKGFLRKIRLYWFVTIASLRDTVFNSAPTREHSMGDEK